MTVGGLFSTLREDLALEVGHYHPGTLGAQALGGARALGWADLWALLAALAHVAARQARRTVPVATVDAALERAEAVVGAHPPRPAKPAP